MEVVWENRVKSKTENALGSPLLLRLSPRGVPLAPLQLFALPASLPPPASSAAAAAASQALAGSPSSSLSPALLHLLFLALIPPALGVAAACLKPWPLLKPARSALGRLHFSRPATLVTRS